MVGGELLASQFCNRDFIFQEAVGGPDAKVGTAKHENILIDELALFQPLFSRQKAAFIYYPHFPLDNSHFPLANTKSSY